MDSVANAVGWAMNRVSIQLLDNSMEAIPFQHLERELCGEELGNQCCQPLLVVKRFVCRLAPSPCLG